MLKALYILADWAIDQIYGPEERGGAAKLVDVYAPPQTPESVAANPALLHDAQVILTGWGAPYMDAAFLAAAASLQAVFYGSGSIRGVVTDAFWDAGLVISSSVSANAIPVAEYALSQILFSLKRGWAHAMAIRSLGRDAWRRMHLPGAYRSTVGLVSLGATGRKLCELLRGFDLHVIAHDPFVSRQDAQALGAELCSLEDVFSRADVVSLHVPLLPETRGMITGRLLESMKTDATFINTARGAVVREDELADVLARREDLWAVLDVTHPEPPEADSPLYRLPNVILTPHIAGSTGPECRRMGRYMVDELGRYVRGEPLKLAVTREQFRHMA